MNDNIEFDVLVNGKKARTELGKVEAAQDKLEQTTIKTNNTMSSSWFKIGATIATAGYALTKTITSASNLSKATFGLSNEMKNFATSLSNATGFQQELIAGFLRSGETAGLAESTVKKLAAQAIALGRAYPHESAETLHDNLVMLNKTGEAQGFIVDILEQKYGKVDLASISLADKLKTIENATAGINDKFSKTAGAKLDTLFTKLANSATTFGGAILNLADKWGWLDTANKGLNELNRSMKDLKDFSMQELQDEYDETQAEINKILKANNELRKQLNQPYENVFSLFKA